MQDIQNQVILITGATDGLGRLVARHLARRGARLLLHGRSPDKGESLVEEIGREAGNEPAYYNADLASLDETSALADRLLAEQPRLDVLINNAGIGPRKPDSPRETSKDGHELFFAVNYLAGFLLTHKLLPRLKESAPSRIVNVASVGQAPLDFDDLMLEQGYDDFRAYRQSKLAQIMFTFDLAEELEGSGVTANCLHPATLMDTKMVQESGYFPGSMTTVEEGAEAVEYLAASPELEGVSGQYFDGKNQERANAQAYEAGARNKLREISIKYAGLS